MSKQAVAPRGSFWRGLFFQVVAATLIGIAIGVLRPHLGEQLKPLGDGFVRLIKMVFAPIIFLTVSLGVARLESLKELGRVGIVALLYFEVVSTLALILGLVTVHLLQPGQGMNIDAATLDTKALSSFMAAKPLSFDDFLLNIIPVSVTDAFARNDVLQIIFFSLLLGVALSAVKRRAAPLIDAMEGLTEAVFHVLRLIMRLAPIGTLGAIAFTVGKYGSGSILSMGKVLGAMFLACFLFIVVVLNLIAWLSQFSLLRLMAYIKDELVTVFATGSSESVLPQIMAKLVRLGLPAPVVGISIPAGLTFNPDGQCIYYTLAAIFIAQATNTPLPLSDQLLVLGVLMVASKGSAGVTGSGFITLAAVLSSLGTIPVAGMVLLLGVDPFMSRARGFTNTLGNTVAAMVIGRWVGKADMALINANLGAGAAPAGRSDPA